VEGYLASKQTLSRTGINSHKELHRRKSSSSRRHKNGGYLTAAAPSGVVVLPQDILTVSPDSLLSMKIDMTIVGGKILYDRSA